MTDRPTWTTEKRKLGDLREWERNPRELSEHDAKHLAQSLEKFNLADPLVINLDGQIIGGHQRKRVMMVNGYMAADLVDVRMPSRQLTDREAAELNVRLNRNAGAFDWDILANEFEVADLLDWGFTAFDLEMHDLGEEPEPADDPGAQLDKAAELQEKWQVERGQVWEIGSHRVMCGDSTCAEDVARLMAGEKAAMVMADPPYGIEYQSARRTATQAFDVQHGDNEICGKWIPLAAEFLIDTGAMYICTRWDVYHRWRDEIVPHIQFKNLIVLDKVDWSSGDLAGDYSPRHEFIFYCVKGRHILRGCRDSNVWNFGAYNKQDYLHSTQKKVELVVYVIGKSSDSGDVVMDLFLGSGTTIVACEQTGRRGFGMEICEKYVSVTLQRLADMGLEPRLAE